MLIYEVATAIDGGNLVPAVPGIAYMFGRYGVVCSRDRGHWIVICEPNEGAEEKIASLFSDLEPLSEDSVSLSKYPNFRMVLDGFMSKPPDQVELP